MAHYSSILARRIPWMEEPGRLQSMGLLRVGHLLSDFTFTFHLHALEKEMATRSSVLAWRIPGTGEPGGLPSMGSHRVGQDWCDLAAAAAAAAYIYIRTHTHAFFFFWWTFFIYPFSPLYLLWIYIYIIPWTEEPGRLQSMGSLRVGHDWATSLSHLGEGNGNPLQRSCLENPRDGGAWWAAIYGVAQSRARLKQLSSSIGRHVCIFKSF